MNDDDARFIHTVIYAEMMRQEALENYEVCSEIQEHLSLLGSYVLGYCEWSSIQQLVYMYARLLGSLQSIDPEGVTFELGGRLFYFYVDEDERTHLKRSIGSKSKK